MTPNLKDTHHHTEGLAWVTLDAVTLTNTSQLYSDISAPGQPPRLYRLVPSPRTYFRNLKMSVSIGPPINHHTK
jgi:hypothetical protein